MIVRIHDLNVGSGCHHMIEKIVSSSTKACVWFILTLFPPRSNSVHIASSTSSASPALYPVDGFIPSSAVASANRPILISKSTTDDCSTSRVPLLHRFHQPIHDFLVYCHRLFMTTSMNNRKIRGLSARPNRWKNPRILTTSTHPIKQRPTKARAAL